MNSKNISNKILPWGDSNALGIISSGFSLEMSEVKILFKNSMVLAPEIFKTFLFLR